MGTRLAVLLQELFAQGGSTVVVIARKKAEFCRGELIVGFAVVSSLEGGLHAHMAI